MAKSNKLNFIGDSLESEAKKLIQDGEAENTRVEYHNVLVKFHKSEWEKLNRVSMWLSIDRMEKVGVQTLIRELCNSFTDDYIKNHPERK